MDDNTLELMLFGSLFLGAIGVSAFIWALRSGQFDDEKKFMQGVLYDGEEELREAIEKEKRIKETKDAAKSRQDGEKIS
jgi:cbb3-type cytochrome oxidase maturation protein